MNTQTIPLPEEPPVGSTATWTGYRGPRTATRGEHGWLSNAEHWPWSEIVSSAMRYGHDLTVTTPPARPLPTHKGAFIRASGTDSGDRFGRKVLTCDGSDWWSLDGNTTVLLHRGYDDAIDPDWEELILVAKDEHERQTAAIERVRKVIDGSSTVIGISTIRAALDGYSS